MLNSFLTLLVIQYLNLGTRVIEKFRFGILEIKKRTAGLTGLEIIEKVFLIGHLVIANIGAIGVKPSPPLGLRGNTS